MTKLDSSQKRFICLPADSMEKGGSAKKPGGLHIRYAIQKERLTKRLHQIQSTWPT